VKLGDGQKPFGGSDWGWELVAHRLTAPGASGDRNS
jgi:hypothetical protein